MPDRRIEFAGTTWDQIAAMPQPYRRAIQSAVLHLLDEPVPGLAVEVPALPGAYELELPTDGVELWYTVREEATGAEIVTIHVVRAID